MEKYKHYIQVNDKWVEYKGDPRFLRWQKEGLYWKLYVDKKPPIWVKGEDGYYIQVKAP
jgi:hypothetical protein